MKNILSKFVSYQKIPKEIALFYINIKSGIMW